mmetsp:Transcript_14010/g.26175  ORF Transcript_14010/g.26175 Transcript_14010/m.26175 type:complete len:261 (+) Transcript_14010:35-817(+)
MWRLLAVFSAAGVATSSDVYSSNASDCVSNKGLPYSQVDCAWVAAPYGCLWLNGRCTCANHGWYAKSSHWCWPPETSPLTTTTAAATTTTTTTTTGTTRTTSGDVVPPRNGSTCVSNRGHPYDEWHCKSVAGAYGCTWQSGACMCMDGGYFAHKSKHCYSAEPVPPPRPAPTQKPPAGPSPSNGGPGDNSWSLEWMVSWFPGPHWIGWFLDISGSMSCCVCAARGVRRRIAGRQIRALEGQHQAMLTNAEMVEPQAADVA